uniref:Uncharacterized protein n=1 Tax=Lactuca sativa TaxID=4236 RepID=A0A9R1UC53_LACSA|nr:hypothetical protein LSAT_V11C000506790 [Lactuca sativa]
MERGICDIASGADLEELIKFWKKNGTKIPLMFTGWIHSKAVSVLGIGDPKALFCFQRGYILTCMPSVCENA